MHKALVLILIFTLSLGQLTAVLKTGETSIYLFDLYILGFGFFYFLYFLLHKKALRIPKYLILPGLFGLVAVLSLGYHLELYTADQLLVAGFYGVRYLAYFWAAIVVYNLYLIKFLTKDDLLNFILYSGLFISLAGFIQLVILPDFETLDASLGWDPHKNRLASTFFDPNFTGAYLVVCMTILFERFFHKKFKPHLSFFLVLSVLFYAIFLTFSRSAWLMLACVIFVYGTLKSRWFLLLALLLAFSAYYAVPRIQTRISGITDPADSARFRYISWTNTLEVIEDNWITGVGYNTMRYVQKDYGYLDVDTFDVHSGAGSDSSLLFVFATTGLIGIIVYILAFSFPIFEIFASNKINVLLLALILSLMLESLFINSLFYPQLMFLWMTIFALNSPDDRSHSFL